MTKRARERDTRAEGGKDLHTRREVGEHEDTTQVDRWKTDIGYSCPCTLCTSAFFALMHSLAEM